MDTSTKLFVVWKSFGWNFSASLYSEPQRTSCQVPRELMSRARCTSIARDREEEENIAAPGSGEVVLASTAWCSYAVRAVSAGPWKQVQPIERSQEAMHASQHQSPHRVRDRSAHICFVGVHDLWRIEPQ